MQKIGKYTEETIRAAIRSDRELLAGVAPGWHQSHGCVIDRHGFILMNPHQGRENLYSSEKRDPTKDMANARFVVSMQSGCERRAAIIEALLDRVAELENQLGPALAELDT